MAKTWTVRPSQLLGIKDEYVAFCLDEAVAFFGNEVEAEINGIEGRNPRDTQVRQERKLRELLGVKVRFADPIAMGKVIKKNA